MRKLIIASTALVILFTYAHAVLVDGYCYLEIQTNHEGTKVLFQADSPGAVTDSTFTNSMGYYEIDLEQGFYDIYFTHEDYLDDEIFNQPFFGPVTLPDVTLELPPLIEGYVYLQNQTNHEGTKILFEAVSGGAETDSTFSDATGYYSIIINPGTYDIVYSHERYNCWTINNQSISNDITLPEVTLTQALGILISGPLIGVLAGDTTYFVIDDISVENGDSLIIQAGATLIFSDGVRFDINGYIHAAGNETDSVKFINSLDSTWGGIYFNDSANNNSLLEYCLITGSSSSGIYCLHSSPSITNCAISGNTAYSGGGIYCIWDSSPSITNCAISGNMAELAGGGICSNDSSPSITNCIISGNTAENKGGGIYCGGSSLINNCDISGNTAGWSGGGIYCEQSSPAITNCTISGNTAPVNGNGICCYYSSPAILNTVVEGNFGNYGFYLYSSPNTNITYSDFYNNQGGNFYNPPQWVGQIVTVNANGDSCDMYYNIFYDPLFYSTIGDSAYYLTAESPCIDAGDPNSPLDPDGTIADIGAFYFPQYTVFLNPSELNFETVGVSENRTLPLWIINNSPSSVIVNEILTTNPVFYTDFTPVIQIDSGDSIDVMVTFEPDSMLNYDEILWVYTSIDTLEADLLGEGIASLIESEPDTLDFLALELGMDSTLSVVFRNFGNDTMLFYQIISSDPAFTIDFPTISDPVLPGAYSDTCRVTFTPEEEILYEDSLFVLCNAFNTVNDTFIVYLRGEGGIIPAAVENLVIETVYPDVVLTWNPVTVSIYGSPITVDYYLIFFETDPYSEFEFLAGVADTTYTHELVVQFSEQMFYEVIAFIGEIGELEAFFAANNGEFTKAEFKKRINR